MQEHSILLKAQEVADYVKVSVSTVWRWKTEGKLPFIKVGNVVRFKAEEVDKFIKKCERL